MSAPVDNQQLTTAQPVAALQDWKERIAQAHDASLDDDGRGCRAILMTLLADMTAAPAPALVPLTDEQIDEIAAPFVRELGGDHWHSGERGIHENSGAQDFARAIERAHGIGSKA